MTGVQPVPKEPTDAPPGTAEKLRVIAERARRGEQLWHPDDAKDVIVNKPHPGGQPGHRNDPSPGGD